MANRADYLEQLAAVPLLRSCTKRELERVARAADEVHVEAGRQLVEEGPTRQRVLRDHPGHRHGVA